MEMEPRARIFAIYYTVGPVADGAVVNCQARAPPSVADCILRLVDL